MTIAFGLEKLQPSITLELLLEGNGLADLKIFDLNKLVINVAVRMGFS